MDMLTLRQGIINWKNTYAKTNTGQEMIKGQDWDQVGGTVYFYKVWDPKKEMLNNYTFSQQHNLSVSGGSDKINYYISGGYSYDGGIFKLNPDDVKKYNITASVNANVTPWLDLNVKTMFRNFQYDYPYQYQDYWYYFWRWGSYFPYGTYQGKYFRTNSAYLSQASKSNLSSNYSRIDLGATVKILKNLNFRADYTIGRDNLLRHEGGGPVMAWGTDAFVISFVSPHSLHARSMVLGRGHLVEIDNATVDVPINVIVDGHSIREVPPGGRVAVRLGDEWARLARIEGTSFFSRYRETFST